MRITKTTPMMIFDVESHGLTGQAFAVGGGVYVNDKALHEFCHVMHMPPLGTMSPEDAKWLKENIPPMEINTNSVVDSFWKELVFCRERFPDLQFAGECIFPVETNFVSQVLRCCSVNPLKDSLYPFHDIASMMTMVGLDPMETWKRRKDELPNHNPLKDARLSARILAKCLDLAGDIKLCG